jgi:hypothetical protein
MKKIKSFVITLLIFIGVTALGIFLMETGLVKLFLIGILLVWMFLVVWHLILMAYFNKK